MHEHNSNVHDHMNNHDVKQIETNTTSESYYKDIDTHKDNMI